MFKRIISSLKSRYADQQYKLFVKGIPRPSFEYDDLKNEGFHSQCGQDKWVINNLFKDKKEGVFIDIGAHDGVSFSNSYYLEKLGWSGVAVEPMPQAFKQLSLVRQCTTINACITQKTGVQNFRVVEGYSEMLSGLVNEYDSRHIERIEREIEQHGGKYSDISVNCISFNELIVQNKITKIDYLSIDVEGAELGILQSINFNTVDITLIGVENNYNDYRIPKLLLKNGFKLKAILGDEFYINTKLFNQQ